MVLFHTLKGTAQLAKESKLKGSLKYILEESFEGLRRDSMILKNGKNRQFAWIQDNKMEFDQNNNLVKRSFFDDDRDPLRTENYIFSNDRLQRKELQAFTYFYKHNEATNITDELLVSQHDSTDFKLKQRFKYDANGLLIESWEFDMQGGHVRQQKNQYNEYGKLSKETMHYKDGVEYKTYTYNSDGLLEKLEWFDFQLGLLERITYTYEHGNLKTEFWEAFEDGKIESTTAYVYDIFGNAISILEINKKRQIHDHEINTYTYDEYNNWTKKTTAINNSRFYIVERRIGYYL